MSNLVSIPKTTLLVHELCLGGNVFGWTADEAQSHGVLSAYAEAGGNFIDTADVYSEWGEGHVGGESESVIGSWMQSKANRDQVVIATKVAKLSSRPGLSAANILAAADDSLRRLQTDFIDIYYAHHDDLETPLEETLVAFDSLVKAGKVRYIAASNYSGDRLLEALAFSEQNGLASYVALQNHYNLVARKAFEADSVPALEESGLSAIPYFALGVGFLTGKYREGSVVESARAGGAAQHFNDDGWAVLAAMDEIANEQQTSLPAVALAWLRAQPTVSVPIASARTVGQLEQLLMPVTLIESQVAKLSEITRRL
jgi:hypothetical protein